MNVIHTYWIVYLMTIFNYSVCFNIEERDPVVKKYVFSIDDKNSAYFGFSVAQHETSDGVKWILVGAPLGQNLQPNTNRSGALFKCPITNDPLDCVQVVTDGNKDLTDFDYSDNAILSDKETKFLRPPGSDEIKDNQWLGVTVKSQKKGGHVIVCAHRYIHSDRLDLHHYGTGFCYVLNSALVMQDVLEPCLGRSMENLHMGYGLCQAGTSVCLLENGVALIGTPGPLAWRGTIFAKQIDGEYLKRDKTVYHAPLEDNTLTERYSYLGMSASGGHFFSKTKLSYASGAPRSINVGEVLLFDQIFGNEVLEAKLRLKGEQFAAGFGYELLSTDINMDGYDDLLVGAPFYFEENNVGGAVYIYYNLKNCTNEHCEREKLTGKGESRFGFSMTAIGDINKDGYTDVAIGAPYEENGVVYIYLGSQNGLQPIPSQMIKSRNVRSLGYSLSGGLDMDGNKYPDLIVGAYESDMVILYKTRPIIDIKIDVSGDFSNINATKKGCKDDPNSNNTCFSIKCCFSIEEEQRDSFFVEYHIEEVLKKTKKVSRIWFNEKNFPNKHSHFRNISNIEVYRTKRDICQTETVYLKEGVRDILSPIEFRVQYLVQNDLTNSPMLNKTSLKNFQATFQKDCGGDDICESNMILTAGFEGYEPSDQYLLNLAENEELRLDVNITNIKDAAYEAKLFVTHPEKLSYISLGSEKEKPDSVDCTFKSSTLVICSLGNPFTSRKSANLTLRFEILKDADPVMEFKAFVNSTSTELSNKTSTSFVAILQKMGKFQLDGKSLTTTVFFGGEIKGESAMNTFEDIGARVKHRYEISNTGDWTLQHFVINISWPYQLQSRRSQGKWLLYLEKTPEIEKGTCYVDPPVAVNPLRLNSSGLTVDEPENVTRPISFTEHPENIRRRRDLENAKFPVPESLRKLDDRSRDIVTLDCRSGTTKCVYIICKIPKLNKNEQTTIDIYSRVWISTLSEDFSTVDFVNMRSRGQVYLEDETIKIDETSKTIDDVETAAYPNVVPPESQVSLWIIIVSAVLGILILLLVIFVMYKLGFFKRNRVDPTLTGNLKKNGESESLIQINDSKK